MLKRIIAVTSLLLALTIFSSCSTPAELLSDIKEQQNTVAQQWAEALKARDGEARYILLTEEQQQRFYEELQAQSGDSEVNWVIGVSSPWVVDYQVEVANNEALITYHTTTSAEVSYILQEKLSFKQVKDKWLINNYQTVVDYLDEESYNKQSEN